MTRLALPLLVLCVACQQAPPPAPPPAAPRTAAPHPIAPPAPAAAHQALKWTDPPAWKRTPPSSSMRQAQFAVPKVGTDAEDGELVVFYFGAGQGGSVDDNLARWEGQFQLPDGKPAASAAKVEKRKVKDLPVTVVQVEGTYAGSGMMGAPASPKEHWALLGAIVETGGGPWFFKLTGPAATVAAGRASFDSLIASLHVE